MTRVVRGALLTFKSGPQDYLHEPQGAVVIGDNGRILWRGSHKALPEAYRSSPVDDFSDCLIMPGFVDAHIHFPQYRMLAAPGKDLLDWLSRFTFPEEARYADAAYASAAAEKFLDRLVTHGTTAAMVFSSVHRECADALFAAAGRRRMAVITGKTMMDRDVPATVRDTPEEGAAESEALYRKWHGKDRLRYAVTPRFAVTSSEAQLAVARDLMTALPDALMQTHLSESPGELKRIRELYPNDADYTAVYDRFGLLSDRSVFAHGIHLSDRECRRLSETGSIIAHCPTSNMFLGSGLMSMTHLGKRERPVHVALGTDVGGGTSYSMLATLGATYKVQMLAGYRPSAFELFHLATRRNAELLRLDGELGALDPGTWADIVVIDPRATDVLASRQELSQSLEDMLFALAILGDDRAIRATYVAGRKVHERRVQ
jgi:guanine deaminase